MLTGLVNRRKTNRIPFQDEVNILLESNGRALALATATNISGGGIQFHVPRGLLRLQPGETIDLIFNILKFGETVITGEIRYLLDGIDNDGQPVSYFGVRFLNINEALLKGLEIFCTGPILDSPPAEDQDQPRCQPATVLAQLLEKVRSLPDSRELAQYLLDNNDPEKTLTQGSIDRLVQMLLDAQRVRQSLDADPDPASPAPIYQRAEDGAPGPIYTERTEEPVPAPLPAESSPTAPPRPTEVGAPNPSLEKLVGESPYQSLVDQLVQSMLGVAANSARVQPSADSQAPSVLAEPLSAESLPQPEALSYGPALFGDPTSPIPADNESIANEGRFPATTAPDSEYPGNRAPALPGRKEAGVSTDQQSIDHLVQMLLTQNQSAPNPIPQPDVLPESAPQPEIALGEMAGAGSSDRGEPETLIPPPAGYNGQAIAEAEQLPVNGTDSFTPGLGLAGNISSSGTPLPSLPPLFKSGIPFDPGPDPAPDATEAGAFQAVAAEPNGPQPEVAGASVKAPAVPETAVNPASPENIPESGTCNAQIQFKEGKSVPVIIEDLNIGGVTVRLNELIPEKSHVSIHFSYEGYLISNITAICDWSGRYRGGDYLAGFIFGQLTSEQSTQLRSLIQKFNY